MTDASLCGSTRSQLVSSLGLRCVRGIVESSQNGLRVGEGSDRVRVLFVCTGNICRSPTAERLAVLHASRLEVADFHASSAGVRAVRGHAIHSVAALVLERLGGTPGGFTAKQLNPKHLSDADLVVTMTRQHRDAVLEIAPTCLRRTYLLSEIARLVNEFGARSVPELTDLRARLAGTEVVDIPDPIGQDTDVFWQVGHQIAELVPAVVQLCRSSPR